MCGGGGVQDNSHLVAEQNRQAAREAREAEAAESARQEALFSERLNSAFTGARGNVESFFNQQGLDPSEYAGLISSGLNRKKSAIPHLDTSPGTYFEGLGKTLFDEGSTTLRNKNNRLLDQFVGSGFENELVRDDLDDSAIEAILDESFSDASKYGEGLLKRGVITGTGFNGAIDALDKQRSAARRRLTELGDSVLESQRGSLRDIAGEARSSVNNLNLGDLFDPDKYRGRVNNSFDDFVAGLGEELRGFTPNDLFDTSDFAINAGSSQGAQNTGFSSNALAGLFSDEDEDEEELENENELDFSGIF